MSELSWQKRFLKELENNNICTDSDIEDFADEEGLNHKEVFHFVARLKVEGTPCEKCKYCDYYPDNYPCTYCTRLRIRVDHFAYEE